MIRPWLLIALLAAGAALARPKRAIKRRPAQAAPAAAPAGPGQVRFVTSTHAYLDRGSADGLAVGREVTFTRAGRVIGRCTISTLSEKWSSCRAEGLKIGDRLAVERKPPPAPPPLTVVPPAAELQQRRQKVEAEPPLRVEFSGRGHGLLGRDARLASVAVSHSTWANLALVTGPFHVQRIDVGVYDLPIAGGLHGSADLSVLNFAQRPAEFLSQFGTPVVLVRQLELSFHTPRVPLIAQLGRTWTRYTPGLRAVDGAQAAWRNEQDTFEIGAYGGLLPDAVSLGLSTGRWTVGAFVMSRFEAGRGAGSSLFQVEARLGYSLRAQVPGRFELGLAVHTWITRSFDAHLQLEVGAGGAMAPGLVDALRLDFGWRPAPAVRLQASGRYLGTAVADGLELGAGLPGAQQAFHGDFGLTLELWPVLWLGASAGVASDLAGGLTQTRLGPELTFPRLFGSEAALALGYQEELGWLRGRTGWLQLTLVPVRRLRVLARGSWFYQQPTAGEEGIAGHEVGAALIVDLELTRWLWLRATALGRGQPGIIDPNPGSPIGGTVMGQVGGQL